MKRILPMLAVMGCWLAPPVAAQPALYLANSNAGNIEKIPSNGGSFTDYVTGISFPVGVVTATDGSLYYSDQGLNKIFKVGPAGGAPAVYAAGTSVSGPSALALDANGFLYVADTNHNRIMKVAPGGLSATVLATASGFAPLGLALNPTGTILYASDTQAQEVYQMSTVTPPTTPYTPTPVASVAFATGLAVGSNGTVYAASFTTGSITAIASGGGTSTYATGFATPYGLAFDPAGNLFVSNEGNGTVSRVPIGGGGFTTYVSGFDQPYFIAFAPVPEPGAVMFACAAAGGCIAGWRRWRSRGNGA